MFSRKAKNPKVEPFDQDGFLEGIKKDMTSRSVIAAKQESTINKLVEELQAQRKELRSMRVIYEKRMKMDDEIIDRFMQLLDKRRQ